MTHIINDVQIENNLAHTNWSPALTTTTTTTSGTLALSNTSVFNNVIRGTAAGYTVVLPNATTLTKGWRFDINNKSSQPIAVNYYGNGPASPLPSDSFVICTLEDNSTAAGTWLFFRAFTGTASGILNYTLSAADTFSLTSGTADVLIGGTTPMTITPVAGTYAIWYTGSCTITGNNTSVRTSIYRAETIWTDSLRVIASSVSTFNTNHGTMGIVPCSGSQAIEIRVARTANTLDVKGRSLILIRLGD